MFSCLLKPPDNLEICYSFPWLLTMGNLTFAIYSIFKFLQFTQLSKVFKTFRFRFTNCMPLSLSAKYGNPTFIFFKLLIQIVIWKMDNSVVLMGVGYNETFAFLLFFTE